MNLKSITDYIKYTFKAKDEHALHSPFLFNFYVELINNPYPFSDFEELNKERNLLMNNSESIEINDFGAGSKKFKKNKRHINEIVKYGIAQKKQAEFLYRLVNYFNPKTIIELGTSIGLTTMYLAKAAPKATVYSIEGSSELVRFSKKIFKKNSLNNIHSIVGNFDTEFPKLLSEIDTIDFLYIDGNHAYEPTISYFKLALTKKNNHSVFVFDDIYWSEEMKRAWKEISNHDEVTVSLDFYYFGIVLFRKESKNKEYFTLKLNPKRISVLPS